MSDDYKVKAIEELKGTIRNTVYSAGVGLIGLGAGTYIPTPWGRFWELGAILGGVSAIITNYVLNRRQKD